MTQATQAVTAGALVWAFAFTGEASAQAVSDVQVNASTSGTQAAPVVAMDSDENFVVVWDSTGQDGHLNGIFARRFDATGVPLSPEFQVSSYTTDAQRLPAVAMRSSGEFAVVWQSLRQDGSFGGVFGQLFDSSGNAVGSEFQVNSQATYAQRSPSVAMDESGRFVVVWQGYTPGGLWDVWGRQFDASGAALGSDFLVNGYSTDQQTSPSVAVDGAGNFVVVWGSYLSNSCAARPFGRRFDSSGVPQGPDFPVSSSGSQAAVRVAVADAGAFMVVWQDCAYQRTVSARVFDSSGAPVGSEIQVDTAPPPVDRDNHIRASDPSVAADEAGNFVVAWHRTTYRYFNEDNYGYYDHHIRTRHYDASGNPQGPGSAANTFWHPWLTNGNPAVATRKPGKFIVAWDGNLQDGSGSNVFARSPDVVFSDGFETGDLSSWSSSAVDGGDLGVSSAAKMAGSPSPGFGLQAVVDDQAGIYVQDDSPADETRYRARFYLDPNGFDPGEAISQFRQHVFLAFEEAPLKRLVLIILKRQGGLYSIAAHVRRDDNTLAMTSFAHIADGPNAIEFDWERATAPGADDGRLELWVNGTSVATLTGLDNDQRSIGFVRMGAMSVKAGASGTLFFDEFVSRRLAYIGP